LDYDELKRKYETIMDSVTLSTESYDYMQNIKVEVLMRLI